MTVSLMSKAPQFKNIQSQLICKEEGPLATIYEELLKIIFSTRQIYSPPFIVRRSRTDVRLTIHALMVVSKRWRATMRDLIVPLLNQKIINWSYLPLVSEKMSTNPICMFLKQSNRASMLTCLDLNDLGRLNSDRLGEIVTTCINVQSLALSHSFFDFNHLKKLTSIKFFTISQAHPMNVSAIGSLSTLESVKIINCSDGIAWSHFNTCTSLKRLYIHIPPPHTNFIRNLPKSLTSLSLFNTVFEEKDPFHALIHLKHLSFSKVNEDFPSLKNLHSLESLEIACIRLPEEYLENAPQIKRLKVSYSENLPSMTSLTRLTQLFLESVDYPELSYLTQLTELKMVNCEYNWRTFADLTNLKKLTLNSWNKGPIGIALYETPNLEMLNIRSNILEIISARTLSSLTFIKINCKRLQELSLSEQVSNTVEKWISKRERRHYIEEFPKGVYSNVALF